MRGAGTTVPGPARAAIGRRDLPARMATAPLVSFAPSRPRPARPCACLSCFPATAAGDLRGYRATPGGTLTARVAAARRASMPSAESSHPGSGPLGGSAVAARARRVASSCVMPPGRGSDRGCAPWLWEASAGMLVSVSDFVAGALLGMHAVTWVSPHPRSTRQHCRALAGRPVTSLSGATAPCARPPSHVLDVRKLL